MTQFVISKDGTQIAFSKTGKGAPLILIDGAFCHRNFGANMKLLRYLTDHFEVYTYDRRGRGESGNTLPYAIEREFEDIEAIVKIIGEPPFIYGISSGAALALEAAKHGVNFRKILVFEAPYITDNSRAPYPANYLMCIQSMINEKKYGEAVKYFMVTGIGLPKVVVWMMQFMPVWKKMKQIAPTLEYDTLMLKNYGSGESLKWEDWEMLKIPVLAISGTKSEKWIQNAMKNLAEALPMGKHFDLAGQNHLVSPKALSPHLINFFKNEQ
jgi:pimeloyl-ACP methyl ester carboxylesterase